MNSNLNINSNVYLMPENFSYFKISERHKKFIDNIKDRAIFDRLPDEFKKHGTDFQTKENFGVCSSHPSKALSYGPIMKNNQIIYGCRCNIKQKCRFQRISGQDCNNCSKNKD